MEGNYLFGEDKESDAHLIAFLNDKKRELQSEETSVDEGYMFCEDCREWHGIFYMQTVTENNMKGTSERMLIGLYSCGDKAFLWSIDGARVD